jgi:hypothetical protein
MTTSTTARRPSRRSAFPPDVSDLMPAARLAVAELAAEGKQPSQRALAAKLHIGKPKAAAVLDALNTETTPARPLHLVPADNPTAGPERPVMPVVDEMQELHAGPDDATDLDEGSGAGGDATDLDDVAPPAPAVTAPAVHPSPAADPAPTAAPAEADPAGPDTVDPDTVRRVPVWPVLLLTLPALAAIWSGWVSLGAMAGFGVVHPLPGIADHVTFNTAITLPIGVETYAAYALWVWLARGATDRGGRFAKRSAIVSLIVGAAGQVTYHLLAAAHVHNAPWPVVTLVACLPVAVLGMGAALAHLVRGGHH